MGEIILALFLSGLVGAFLIGSIVLPIIALLRTRRIGELSRRLERLEKELGRARSVLRADQAEPEEETVVTLVPEPKPVKARPSWSIPVKIDTADLEGFIGGRGLGWIAVLLLLLATAFYLKYAFENRWIGELGRVALGILAGTGLCVAGLFYHRRRWRLFSQMLSAGGVVLLYLATYGASGYYHLLPQGQAAFFLVVLVAEVAALALLYEAPAIALMAVIGGLLNPVLLHTEQDQYRSLFTYLALLDAGVVALTIFRAWPMIGTVALLGTQGLFWAWYGEHYHPQKLGWSAGFQLVIFALFLAQSLAVFIRRQRNAGIEDLARSLLNAFLFALAAYWLLDEDFHAWMGTLMVGLAILYTSMAWLILHRRPEDPRHLFVSVAIALAAVAMVFPLQAEASWIAVGWAVEGLALWWVSLRIRAEALRGLGAALLVLAVGRLLFVDTPSGNRPPFVPLFNRYGLPATAVTACVLGAAASARRFLQPGRSLDRTALWTTVVVGVVLGGVVLTKETYDYFIARIPPHPSGAFVDEEGRLLAERQANEETHLRRTAQMALSMVWAGYAALILALGFWRRNEALRWMALGLFAVTLVKVFVIDMAGLPGFYRVAAFFVLALIMGAAAWGYQKVLRMRPKGEGHDLV